MASLHTTEILDLRHASGRQMRPLLEAEAKLWEQALRWDYRSATELLLDYLNGHILPGFITLEHGEVRGFAFCVYEGQKAVIGDAFSQTAFLRAPGDEGRDPGLNSLLDQLISLLRASPGVDRIEAQLLLYPSGSLDPIFRPEGFAIYRRYFMESALAPNPAHERFEREFLATPEAVQHGELTLRRWAAPDFQLAAELIHSAYEGHVDAHINDQYRTLHGSLRFLHNIVRFPGCGVFDATHSWVLEERRTGTLAAILLCSRVADDVSHITQLCVAPRFRGRRLGAHLLAFAATELRRAGYAAMSLTVSEDNHGAVALYREAGFVIRRSFDATVLDLRSPRS